MDFSGSTGSIGSSAYAPSTCLILPSKSHITLNFLPCQYEKSVVNVLTGTGNVIPFPGLSISSKASGFIGADPNVALGVAVSVILGRKSIVFLKS